MAELRYPFGVPLSPRPPSADGPRELYVLGAYPSALHVRWTPPAFQGSKPVAALPVADEPEPFWNGNDAEVRVAAWIDEPRLDASTFGEFSFPKGMNGTSGRWVDERVLAPLGVTREQACISDCLDTYRTSTAVRERLRDTYDRGRELFGWPAWHFESHPSESQIVTEALASHADRIRAELSMCQPSRLVTLGNAALRVMRDLTGSGPPKLAIKGYGSLIAVELDGRKFEWLPLAHPAAPQQYLDAHQSWLRTLQGDVGDVSDTQCDAKVSGT